MSIVSKNSVEYRSRPKEDNETFEVFKARIESLGLLKMIEWAEKDYDKMLIKDTITYMNELKEKGLLEDEIAKVWDQNLNDIKYAEKGRCRDE